MAKKKRGEETPIRIPGLDPERRSELSRSELMLYSVSVAVATIGIVLFGVDLWQSIPADIGVQITEDGKEGAEILGAVFTFVGTFTAYMVNNFEPRE